MTDEKVRLGFAICGSFCTFTRTIAQMEILSRDYEILPIMSETAYSTDTRFGKAEDFRTEIRDICRNEIIHTVKAAEPIGPKKMLDILLIAPCTGNTIAKLASGIADSSVTLAAKAHMRNGRPVVIAVSSNDALAGNAENIGKLLNRNNVYFVPFEQDDPKGKPRSLVAVMEKIPQTLKDALEGKQIQPIVVG
ncbi:MAG: dipicolinate synthase subunit B [Clostridiales bacterium]|nr:dipicolinate synthase subunit B [Clostridiales bacterium]